MEDTRIMFARLLKKDAVDKIVQMMADEFQAAPEPDDTGFIQIKAPDGDVVFAALPKDGENYICRFHKEVFEEDSIG
jgi:hypothetical protein